MKIAFFGAEGKVGRALVPVLERAGHEVRGFEIGDEIAQRGDVKHRADCDQIFLDAEFFVRQTEDTVDVGPCQPDRFERGPANEQC